MKSFRACTATIAAVSVLLLAGCSSSANSGQDASVGQGGGGGATSKAVLDEAKADVERLKAGTDRALPREGPKALPGKKVWVMACGAAAIGCEAPAEGFADGAKAIGWDVKLVDGKLDPSVYNTLIRSAVAAKVDAVVLVAVDCNLVTGALQAAHAAGVKIYGMYSFDCNEDGKGGKPLFDASIQYDVGSYAKYAGNAAKAAADYVIAKTAGKANILLMRETNSAVSRTFIGGVQERLKDCAGCKSTTVDYEGQDLINGGLQSKTTTALTQDSGVNVVMAPYDAAITLGIGPAVDSAEKSSGRQIILTGLEGLPANITSISQGIQDAAFGFPAKWAGWAAVDGLNRLFAGQPQVDAGIGLQLIDKDSEVVKANDGNGYDGNAKSASAYQGNYKRIWGVG